MKKSRELLKQAYSIGNRELNVELRRALLTELTKEAQEQHGFFQHFQDGLKEYETQEHHRSERGGDSRERDQLYGLSPEHDDTKGEVREPAKSLSTRYSPDRVGQQAMRVGDGLVQDPITNKLYDWREGFTTETGHEYPGGSVDLQTDLVHSK